MILDKSLGQAFLVLSLLLIPDSNYAYAADKQCTPRGPKLKVCKPDICISKTSIPKAARSMISKNRQVISKLKRVQYEGTFVIPPTSSSPPTPQFTIPADRTIVSNCLLRTTGALECGDIVISETCPKTIWLSDEVNRQGYVCDLTCTPNVPDSRGNCECETVPNSCVPIQ
jgi:hypothetical protein